ncbi:hypothetical protein KIN20_007091 [Parelaphostrongylus tenuis]|uniref:Uncharacterized protein n=1 Tax=Parelaphostrongylus tenuis TaxID=148309 RepID=A0AAD5M7A7_PARTN|nr:hypothetical protein KIN20_007091 [Parelaphostrongylus tenuis]
MYKWLVMKAITKRYAGLASSSNTPFHTIKERPMKPLRLQGKLAPRALYDMYEEDEILKQQSKRYGKLSKTSVEEEREGTNQVRE